MNSISAANSSSKKAIGSLILFPSKELSIAWCSSFILTSIFIIGVNLLTIVIFVVSKRLRKKSFFLVINMAFTDLMPGALSLTSLIFLIRNETFQLWTARMSMPFNYLFGICDTILMVASLTSTAFISGERGYAIYWPFKHRTLAVRT